MYKFDSCMYMTQQMRLQLRKLWVLSLETLHSIYLKMAQF